jgi:hypothetical protein
VATGESARPAAVRKIEAAERRHDALAYLVVGRIALSPGPGRMHPLGAVAMTSEITRVTVWTVQPADFDLSQPGLTYDHTRGAYWQNGMGCPRVRERYREVLPILHRHFGVDHILWCWSSLIGWWMTEAQDDAAWEIELTTPAILAHFDSLRWGK